MRIARIEINNYKSFLASGPIDFAPGFNVIVGKNDAGKSALIEALSLRYDYKPHLTLETSPFPGATPTGRSSTLIELELTPEDLRQHLSRTDYFDLFVPQGRSEAATVHLKDGLKNGLIFCSEWTESGIQNAWIKRIGKALAPLELLRFRMQGSVDQPEVVIQGSTAGSSNYLLELAQVLKERIYAFRPQRFSLGESPAHGKSKLEPNATNLADVLNQLQSGNPARFNRMLGYVRQVFPHVQLITARLVGSSLIRVFVWTNGSSTEREDLAVPLAESGTGISQVLAILYVLVTTDAPTSIVIDEPQSFLHPGAMRKLLEILRSHPQHQYILTTHAPLSLSTMSNDKMFLLKRVDQKSVVESIDPESTSGMRMFLTEVGARLGDVFGADSILWVEGKTEELCFPELVRHVAKVPLNGVQILGVISTDELQAKHAERVFEIYQKLAGGTSLLPPAAAFIFDSEDRTAKMMEDLSRSSGNLVRWLPRRMYENYLIEPEPLCKVLVAGDPACSLSVSSEWIVSWLEEHGARKAYGADKGAPYPSEKWFKTVHGGKLLADLFNEATETRLPYKKVMHGLELTRLLSTTPTPAIRELASMIADAIRGPDHPA